MSHLQESDPHPISGRVAVVEDDGDSAWMLLTHADGYSIAADCWLYNRRPFDAGELEGWPRDRPPPAPDEYVAAGAVRPESLTGQLTFVWDADGESVAVGGAGHVLGFIAAGTRRGHSWYLVKEGPWGSVFDAALGQRLFGDDWPA